LRIALAASASLGLSLRRSGWGARTL